MSHDIRSETSLETTIKLLRDVRVGKWADAAGLALFIYDVLLVFNDEYQFIWKARWSFGKVLYLMVRYPFNLLLPGLAIFTNHAPSAAFSAKLCKYYEMSQLYGGVAQFVVNQLVLGLRTVALYDRRPLVTLLVCSSAVVSLGTLFVMCGIQSRHTLFSSYSLAPSFSGCVMDCLDAQCRMIWRIACLPILFFDAVMFFLTLRKHSHDANRLVNMKSPLFRVLYRDGFIYFVASFGSVVVYCVIFNVARPSITLVTYPLMRTIMAICSARLLLELRRSYLRSLAFEQTLVHSESTSSLPNDFMDATPSVGVWGIPHDLSYTYVKDFANNGGSAKD